MDGIIDEIGSHKMWCSRFRPCWDLFEAGLLLKICLTFIDTDLDEIETSYFHLKPASIQTLLKSTQFSRRELQIIYRGFKEVWG